MGCDTSECHTHSHALVLWRRCGEAVNQRSLFNIESLFQMKVWSKGADVIIRSSKGHAGRLTLPRLQRQASDSYPRRSDAIFQQLKFDFDP
ncbi:uncharacterized [Tachysurus ichikawai]